MIVLLINDISKNCTQNPQRHGTICQYIKYAHILKINHYSNVRYPKFAIKVVPNRYSLSNIQLWCSTVECSRVKLYARYCCAPAELLPKYSNHSHRGPKYVKFHKELGENVIWESKQSGKWEGVLYRVITFVRPTNHIELTSLYNFPECLPD